MKLTSATITALAAFMLLTACGPKGGAGASASGAAAAGAPASGPDVEIDPANMPHQRAGLWKTVIDDGDGKPDTSTDCMSGNVPAVPKMPDGCAKFTLKKTFLGAYIMDMSCTTAEYSMTAHAVVTGDVESHLTGDTTMTMTPKEGPARTMKMHSDATWIGPCPPGQKPDDG
jgi:Protein of unknown function (DUF3617)